MDSPKFFLRSVAENIFNKPEFSDGDFSRLTIVFPNKRARLFLQKELMAIANERKKGAAIWAPRFATSSELLENFGKSFGISHKIISAEGNIRLIQQLYAIFMEQSEKWNESNPEDVPRLPKERTLDSFYSLGEVILRDFNNVDKHLVDAEKLFRNFKEYNQMSGNDFLTPEQIDAIKEYINQSFDPQSELYKEFISIWDVLFEVYKAFKDTLNQEHIAYDGMLHRMVAEHLKQGLPDCVKDSQRFAFVGFNALNGCEKELMKVLYKKGIAYFYWDYDRSIFSHNIEQLDERKHYRDDAGTFLRENMESFRPQSDISSEASKKLSLPDELRNENHDFLSRLKDSRGIISVKKAFTDSAQAKYAAQFIREIKEKHPDVKDDEIAIVLCDEKLLPDVLHSIPNEIKNLNITMGYPLTSTPAYSLLLALIRLQQHSEGEINTGKARFYHTEVISILRHSIVKDYANKAVNAIMRKLAKEPKVYISQSDMLTMLEEYNLQGTRYPVPANQIEFIAQLFSRPCQFSDDAELLIQWLIDLINSMRVVYKRPNDADPNNYTGLYEEAYYQTFMVLNNVLEMQKKRPTGEHESEQRLSCYLFQSLIPSLFASLTVNYTGEPAKGMQIMGFLETRNLDFKHVLILSADDKNMPKSSANNSFVPYFLQSFYGLPTTEHQDALYSFNFYRLLQRLESVTILYNSDTQSMKSSGEVSRFIRQLKVEYNAFDHIDPLAQPQNDEIKQDELTEIQLTEEEHKSLVNRFKFRSKEELGKISADTHHNEGHFILSPSAINDYIACPMRFYFKYVKVIKSDSDYDEDMNEADFGNVFHESLEAIYCELANKQVEDNDEDWKVEINIADLENKYLKNTAKIQDTVLNCMLNVTHLRHFEEFSGILQIKYKALVKYVERQLRHDLEHVKNNGGKITICRPEYRINQPVRVPLDGDTIAINVGGIVDHRDICNGIYRIVDYKTGKDKDNKKRTIKAIASLYDTDGNEHKKEASQILLYSWLLNQKGEDCNLFNPHSLTVKPALMYPNQMHNDQYCADLKIGENSIELRSDNPEQFEDEIGKGVKSVLSKIFAKDAVFKGKDECGFCPFQTLCHKDGIE